MISNSIYSFLSIKNIGLITDLNGLLQLIESNACLIKRQ